MKGLPLIMVLEPSDMESHKMMGTVGVVRYGPVDQAYSEAQLIEELSKASAAVVTSRDKITRKVIASAPYLKIIAKCGAKPSNVDLEAATEYGVPVTWTPGSNPTSVAEHALTLMLALLKEVPATISQLKQGGWRTDQLKASELAEKTVGIIGLGQSGYRLAQLLNAFDCRVLCHDPYVSSTRAREVRAEQVDLDTLLASSDVVSLHCQMCAETHHMIDEGQLRKMKRSAYLVNTGRGPLVNEKTLVRALKESWIAGAGLDVFETEPAQKDNPLFSLPNVVVTPHMAGWTHEALRRETRGASEEVIRVLSGQAPANVANPEYMAHKRS